MKTPKGIIAVSNYLDKEQDELTLTNPNITGIFVRVRWSTINPSKGVYNWTLIDNEIDNASKHNKGVSIGIVGGENSPTWLKEVGVPYALFDYSNHQGEGKDKQLDMPIFYHADFLRYYNKMIFDLSEHLKITGRYSKVDQIKINGINSETAETRQPTTPIQTWIENGYTKAKTITAWNEIAANVAKQFPDKSLGICIIGDPIALPSIDDNGKQVLDKQNDTVKKIVAICEAKYADRIVCQFNAVTNIGGTPLDLVKTKVAYQEKIDGDKSGSYIVDMVKNVIAHKGVFLEVFNKTIKLYPTSISDASKLFI